MTEQISKTIPDPNQSFYSMCEASNFGIGAALLQSHSGTNKMNLISANSQWIKNNTQQKKIKQQSHKKDLFPLIKKENLTDKINLSGSQTNYSKYTINQVFNLHDPLDTIPLSKLEIDNIFLPPTKKVTLEF